LKVLILLKIFKMLIWISRYTFSCPHIKGALLQEGKKEIVCV
jgi:hypothetical protein